MAESVVVMRHLLQRNPEEHGRAMRKMARLIKKVEVPMARASCVWVVGEFAQHMKRLAPDVLRRLAQSFTREVGSSFCGPQSLVVSCWSSSVVVLL